MHVQLTLELFAVHVPQQHPEITKDFLKLRNQLESQVTCSFISLTSLSLPCTHLSFPTITITHHMLSTVPIIYLSVIRHKLFA